MRIVRVALLLVARAIMPATAATYSPPQCDMYIVPSSTFRRRIAGQRRVRSRSSASYNAAVISCAAAVALIASTIPALAAGTNDAYSLYRSALQRMVNMPQPPVVAYTATARATGAVFYVSVEPDTRLAEFGIAIGEIGVNSASWPVVVRPADGSTTIALNGGSAQTVYPIFDATWFGAYSWLRYGFNGKPPAVPAAATKASPVLTPSPEPSVTGIIAVVRAINVGSYRVLDRGDDRCENGDAARRVGLVAYDDPDAHPATDATIDVVTKDICTVRFDLLPTQFLAQSGYVLLHFARVGTYAMVSDEHVRLNTNFRGVGRRRVDIDVQYSNVTFPSPRPVSRLDQPRI